jgi:hypothetical protein
VNISREKEIKELDAEIKLKRAEAKKCPVSNKK